MYSPQGKDPLRRLLYTLYQEEGKRRFVGNLYPLEPNNTHYHQGRKGGRSTIRSSSTTRRGSDQHTASPFWETVISTKLAFFPVAAASTLAVTCLDPSRPLPGLIQSAFIYKSDRYIKMRITSDSETWTYPLKFVIVAVKVPSGAACTGVL